MRKWSDGSVAYRGIRAKCGTAARSTRRPAIAARGSTSRTLTAPGLYYVFDPTRNVRSHPFEIADDVYRKRAEDGDAHVLLQSRELREKGAVRVRRQALLAPGRGLHGSRPGQGSAQRHRSRQSEDGARLERRLVGRGRHRQVRDVREGRVPPAPDRVRRAPEGVQGRLRHSRIEERHSRHHRRGRGRARLAREDAARGSRAAE